MEWLVVAAIIGGFVWWRSSKKSKATDTAPDIRVPTEADIDAAERGDDPK